MEQVEAISEQFFQAIRAGNYLSTAARYAGVSPRTIYRWLEKGVAATSGKYRKFALEYEEARSHAEVQAAAFILRAAKEDWRAALEFLKRRYPSHWSEKKPKPQTISEVEGMQMIQHDYSTEQLDEILHLLHDLCYDENTKTLTAKGFAEDWSKGKLAKRIADDIENEDENEKWPKR